MPMVATKNKTGYFQFKGHSQGQKVIEYGVIWKDLTRMHAKYELSISYRLKVMAKVNILYM